MTEKRTQLEPAGSSATTPHQAVIEASKKLDLGQSTLQFPLEAPATSLNANDYLIYLNEIRTRIDKSELAIHFETLTLKGYDDNAAIEGLSEYVLQNTPLPFKTLTLALNSPLESIEALSALLLKLAPTDLVALQLEAQTVSLENMNELVQFINAHDDIAYDITLPAPFNHSNLQQALDELLSARINNKRLTAPVALQPQFNVKPTELTKRTRPRDISFVAIDVEMDQEQDVDVMLTTTSERPADSATEADKEQVLYYNLPTFRHTIQQNRSSARATTYLMGIDTSDEGLTERWCTWFGAFNETDATEANIRISQTAAEELLRYADVFQSGFDFNRPPAGFSVVRHEDGIDIDFSPRLKRTLNADPLSAKTTDSDPDTVLSHQQVTFIFKDNPNPNIAVLQAMWQTLNTKPYSKEANHVFRHYLPQLLLMSPETLRTLFLFVQDKGPFNAKLFGVFLDNMAAQNTTLFTEIIVPHEQRQSHTLNSYHTRFLINILLSKDTSMLAESHALSRLMVHDDVLRTKVSELLTIDTTLSQDGLLQLYLTYGEGGLDKLLQFMQAEPKLFKAMFNKDKKYTQCMQPEFDAAVSTAKDFRIIPGEKEWWEFLLTEHGKAQSTCQLHDLVRAFAVYKTRAKNLAKTDEVFPLPCQLTGVTSLPTALSRLTTLLSQCREENIPEQLTELGSLDLSSTGMIKAISKPGIKKLVFVTRDMKFSQAHELAMNPDATEYAISSRWQDISTQKKDANYETQTLDKKDLPATIEKFFRFAAYQNKYGGTPLSLYQHVHQQIMLQTHADDVKCGLFALLAGILADGRDFLQDPDATKKYVDKIIQFNVPVLTGTLIGMAVQGVSAAAGDPLTPDMLRNNFLSNFSWRLSYLPPLPMLSQLMAVMCSSFESSENRAIIDELSHYTPSDALFYNGLKDYSDAQLQDNTTIQKHVLTAKALETWIKDGRDLHLMPVLPDDLKPYGGSYLYINNTKLLYVSENGESREVDFTPTDDSMMYWSNEESTYKFMDRTYLENVFKETLKKMNNKNLKKIYLSRGQLGDILPYSENLLRSDDPHIQQVKVLLYQLISSFQLQFPGKYIRKDWIPVINAYQSCDLDVSESEQQAFIEKINRLIQSGQAEQLIAVLSALTRISVKRQSATVQPPLPLLTPKDLTDILDKVETGLPKGERNVKPFLSVLKLDSGRGLSEYYAAMDPKEDISSTLDDYMNFIPNRPDEMARYQLKALLKKVNDEESNKFFIDTLKAICQSFQYEDERYNFVLKLTSAYGLYANELTLNKDRSVLVRLLQDIRDKGTVSYFLDFLEAERQLLQTVSPEQKAAIFVQTDGQWHIAELGNRARVYLDFIERTHKEKHTVRLVDIIPRVMETLLKSQPAEFANRAAYDAALDRWIVSLDTIVKENPGVKQQFLELIDSHLSRFSPSATTPQLLPYLNEFTERLQQEFATMHDKNSVVSLCMKFKEGAPKKAGAEELSPQTLIALLDVITKAFPGSPEDRTQFIELAIALMNNKKGYSLDKFEQLCTRAMHHAHFKTLLLETLYKKAPYPPLEQVLEWDSKAEIFAKAQYADRAEPPANFEAAEEFVEDRYGVFMRKAYDKYDLLPCKRDARNGFKPDFAAQQLALIKFDGNRLPPQQTYLKSFEAETQSMQLRSSQDLLALLKTFNPENPDYDHNHSLETLIAVASELLYRSKGVDGDSMEINTTQYLSLLTMLKTGQHVTANIGTGEGKTRIMMILCACQQAMGKTVDFVTSDLSLASREFVEFQAYFNMIGAPTRMIFQDSSPSDYCKGGINISDPNNLILFRNKARSEGFGDAVIDAPEKRALLLDEADKTFFDSAKNRFNFSDEGDESIRDMPWIYETLMEFFRKPSIPGRDGQEVSTQESFFTDVDLCRETFLDFARNACGADENKKAKLRGLTREKIEELQAMAVVASRQKFKRDFTIEPNRLIQIDTQLKMSSESLLLISNRISKNSKLSFGAHQCLDARLNYLREHPEEISSADVVADNTTKAIGAAKKAFKDALAKCAYPFHIRNEKQIVYSSKSKNLLDEYDEGALLAVTGTAGSDIERQEAKQLYRAKDSAMRIIDVPRHRGLKRRDYAIRLARNHDKQINVIINEIKLARKHHQPILLIGRDDASCARLEEELIAQLGPDFIQYISPQIADNPEALESALDIAARTGQLTISAVTGRGTDIKLTDISAKKKGLKVISTFLPNEREEEQFAGRSGRQGEEGDYIAILDKEALKRDLGQEKTLTGGFYTRTEAYIAQERSRINKREQRERVIQNLDADFRYTLTVAFTALSTEIKGINLEKYRALKPMWSKFSLLSDQAWNRLWPELQKALKSVPLKESAINALLAAYRDEVAKNWLQLHTEISTLGVTQSDGEAITKRLHSNVEKLFLRDFDIELLKGIAVSNVVKYYDHYDRAHDGRAVKYTNWSIPLIASLRGWGNVFNPWSTYDPSVRVPFANLRAWWNGHGQLFADFRASQNKTTIVITGLLGAAAVAVGVTTLFVASFLTGFLAPIALYALIAGGGALLLGVTSGSVGRIADGLTDKPISLASNTAPMITEEEAEVVFKQSSTTKLSEMLGQPQATSVKNTSIDYAAAGKSKRMFQPPKSLPPTTTPEISLRKDAGPGS